MTPGEIDTAKLELALCGGCEKKLSAWALKFGPELTEDIEITALEVQELQSSVDMAPDDQSDLVDELEEKLDKAEEKIAALEDRLAKIGDLAA